MAILSVIIVKYKRLSSLKALKSRIECILKHFKEYPLLVEFTKQFEETGELGQRKKFLHLPSYASDAEKVVNGLLQKHVLQKVENRN